ncbi:MAG: hypothetical protein AAF236_00795 [Verrucomicrobiota bacterium]
MPQDSDHEKASRAAFYTDGFSIDDLEFRPFSLATYDHVQSFGIQALLGQGEAVEDERTFLFQIIALAWALFEDPAVVDELALDLDFAEDEDERREFEKDLRRRVLALKGRLTLEALPKLVSKIREMCEQIAAVDFEVKEKPNDADEESPPGNS